MGSGSFGVVLCCAADGGAMAAVKKIRCDTPQALQRSLREVGACASARSCAAAAAALHLLSLLLLQVLLMCQLRHPNIVSADDVYLPADVAAAAAAASAGGAQFAAPRPCDVFVRMPYYPADLAWLIHSSPQQLTRDHIQARAACSCARKS